jgi:hypothetical protein
VAVIAATLTATPAVARPRQIVDSDPVTEAVLRAVQFWGAEPCAGQVTVTASPAAEAPSSGTNDQEPVKPAAMWSSWSTPWGVNLFEAPGSLQPIEPALFRDCVVHVNETDWPDWRRDDPRFESYCKELVHEYGHLLGHPDVGAMSGTVEYEQPELAPVPPCERYSLVYGHRTYKPLRPRSVPHRRRHRSKGGRQVRG